MLNISFKDGVYSLGDGLGNKCDGVTKAAQFLV